MRWRVVCCAEGSRMRSAKADMRNFMLPSGFPSASGYKRAHLQHLTNVSNASRLQTKTFATS